MTVAVNLMIGWQFDVVVGPVLVAVVTAFAWPRIRGMEVDE